MLHAQPFTPGIAGFNFDSESEFNTISEACNEKHGIEQTEYEIESMEDEPLFKLCKVNPTNLARWFDEIEPLEGCKKAALFYLLDMSCMETDEALENIYGVTIYQGDAEDAARELFDDLHLHEIPEHLHNYIDYAAFQRDLECKGALVEFTYKGTIYTCTNASSV